MAFKFTQEKVERKNLNSLLLAFTSKSGDVIDINIFAKAELFGERVVLNAHHAL